MINNEIVKAWNEEIHLANYVDESYRNGISISLIEKTLDLINRLQADKEALIAGQETLQKALAEKNAEIERLKDAILTIEECLCESDWDEIAVYCMQNDPEMTACIKANIKIEAIKEFVEILKKHIKSLEYNANTPRKTITVQMLYDQINWILKEVMPQTIDGALKEMVGESNG